MRCLGLLGLLGSLHLVCISGLCVKEEHELTLPDDDDTGDEHVAGKMFPKHCHPFPNPHVKERKSLTTIQSKPLIQTILSTRALDPPIPSSAALASSLPNGKPSTLSQTYQTCPLKHAFNSKLAMSYGNWSHYLLVLLVRSISWSLRGTWRAFRE